VRRLRSTKLKLVLDRRGSHSTEIEKQTRRYLDGNIFNRMVWDQELEVPT
jgi:hypothetical protein